MTSGVFSSELHGRRVWYGVIAYPTCSECFGPFTTAKQAQDAVKRHKVNEWKIKKGLKRLKQEGRK